MSSEARMADALLNILGNQTRRRILEMLAEEPRYLLQLSRELGVTMPSIQKHLQILEEGGLIGSFERKSDLGAPPRRYYHLKTSIYLNAAIADGFVTIDTHPIAEKTREHISGKLITLQEQVEQLRKVEEHGDRLKKADSLLTAVDEAGKKLDDEKVFLLNLRQEIQRMVGETIRLVSETGPERRILHLIIGSGSTADPEIISARLEIRERTVEEILNELERKGIDLTKQHHEASKRALPADRAHT